MAYEARKVQYCYVTATNRAGAAAKVLGALKDAKIDLLGFLGFPLKGGKAQLDLVLEEIAGTSRHRLLALELLAQIEPGQGVGAERRERGIGRDELQADHGRPVRRLGRDVLHHRLDDLRAEQCRLLLIGHLAAG